MSSIALGVTSDRLPCVSFTSRDNIARSSIQYSPAPPLARSGSDARFDDSGSGYDGSTYIPVQYAGIVCSIAADNSLRAFQSLVAGSTIANIDVGVVGVAVPVGLAGGAGASPGRQFQPPSAVAEQAHSAARTSSSDGASDNASEQTNTARRMRRVIGRA